MKEITSSNWQAWINQQPIQPTPAGTLNVTGEIVSHPSQAAQLTKMVPQGINPGILLLEVKLHHSIIPVKQPQMVHYHEVLATAGQYSSIDIMCDGQTIATITNIPIIF